MHSFIPLCVSSASDLSALPVGVPKQKTLKSFFAVKQKSDQEAAKPPHPPVEAEATTSQGRACLEVQSVTLELACPQEMSESDTKLIFEAEGRTITL